MKLNHIDNGHAFDFGRTSADYAKYRDIYPQSMYEKLIAFGIGRRGQRILDLGSGTAVLPVHLCHTGAEFVATDIAENQVRCGKQIAAQKGIDTIQFKVCSAENTGFSDNSFDVVTAVQCFQYFNAEQAVNEISRVLKPNGLFCTIFMDWLPLKDKLVAEMENLVLQYNPDWSGKGFEKFRYAYPDWAENTFDIQTIHSYEETLTFSKEAWIGRIKSCRGVGASLSQDKVDDFVSAYRRLLEPYAEPLRIKHQIHMEIYRSIKQG